MTEEKIALIDKICKFHPSLGVEKGWSHYTGGMKDSGSWHFRQMLNVPIEELQEFYVDQVWSQWRNRLAQIEEDIEFKSSGLSLEDWTMKKFIEFKISAAFEGLDYFNTKPKK